MLACAQINSRVGPISGRRRHRRASPSSSRAHRRLADVVSPLSTRPRRRRAAPSSLSSSRHRRAPGAIVSPASTRPIVVVSPTLSSRSRHRLTDVVSPSSKRALQPSSRVSTRRRLAVDTKQLTSCLDTRIYVKQFTVHRGSAAAAMLPRRSSRCASGRVVRWQQRKQPNINADERITQLRSTLAARDKSGVRHLE